LAVALFLGFLVAGHVYYLSKIQLMMRYTEAASPYDKAVRMLGAPVDEWSLAEWESDKGHEDIKSPPLTVKVAMFSRVFGTYCYVFVDEKGLILSRGWFDT